MPNSPDYDLDSYHYELEQELIAQHPSPARTDSRLLILDSRTGSYKIDMFQHLDDYLDSGSLLVANNTRVLPARLEGQKATGGRVEFLLLTPLPLIVPEDTGQGKKAVVECLLKASRRVRPGEEIFFPAGVGFRVLENADMGRTTGELIWKGNLADYFIKYGHVPLPPYIQRKDEEADLDRYQTVYSSENKLGSVAAPTAGLHFSPQLRERLAGAGFGWTEVTLYVGYGTFSPVRSRDIRTHKMHPEYIEVSSEAAANINEARARGDKIVAVGTTTVRTLESVCVSRKKMTAYRGWTDLFIYPGYRFKAVDQLITNFHLPGSSLIMMVSALAGRENILRAYQKARKEKFRFFSYGDAMVIV
ncbi:MAG: tRNA preQ1(34) S-adenosylmethionine ribosyltransferase-isomerase QueA [Desulfonatronovibrio sp.]